MEPISSLPTDPTGGTPVPSGNDVSTHVALPPGQTVTLFDETHSDLYINTNGLVSFDAPVPSSTEAIPPPSQLTQISGLLTDLDTSLFGQVSYLSLADRLAITWQAVPAFGVTDYFGGNTFQIELFYGAPGTARRIRLSWLDIDVDHAIVGISKGIHPDSIVLMDFSTHSV